MPDRARAPHVLVIDDEDAVRTALCATLNDAGCAVTQARDGAAALELLRADPPDAVLMDIYMPLQDGFEAIRELRRVAPAVKIIAISGGSEKMSYYLSGGYSYDGGMFKMNPDAVKKYNVTAGINASVTDWLDVSAKMLYRNYQYDYPYAYQDYWYYFWRWGAYFPYGTYQGHYFRVNSAYMDAASKAGLSDNYTRIDLGATLNRVGAAHPELKMQPIDDIWPQESFYTRSDHYNFARKGVPILFFFNGTHPDYHRPSDSVDKIDAEKESRIVKLVFYLGLDVANGAERPKWNPDSYARIVTGGSN